MFDVKVVFNSRQIFCSMLTKVKVVLALGKQSFVVHWTTCGCGKVYISELIQRLETRIKEWQSRKLVVAEHVLDSQRPIIWEETGDLRKLS